LAKKLPKVTNIQIVDKPTKVIDFTPAPGLEKLPWKKQEEISLPAEWEEFKPPVTEIVANPFTLEKDTPSEVCDQNHLIRLKCEQLAEFLCEKNTSYGGPVFKDVHLMGRTVSKEDLILARISDKIKRIQGGKEYAQDDSALDLCGYLVLYSIICNKDFK
jgi:hypothetical protein